MQIPLVTLLLITVYLLVLCLARMALGEIDRVLSQLET